MCDGWCCWLSDKKTVTPAITARSYFQFHWYLIRNIIFLSFMPRQTYKGFLIGPPSPHPMLNGKMVNGKILPHSAQFWFFLFFLLVPLFVTPCKLCKETRKRPPVPTAYLIFVHIGTPPLLFRPVKVHKKCINSWQNCQNWSTKANISRSLCKKVHRLEKSTRPPVVAVGTNMSYDRRSRQISLLLAKCFPSRK